MKKLWMLYHLGYWDGPLNGIGIYGESKETGERIFFEKRSGELITCFELSDADKTIPLLELTDDIKESIKQFIKELPRPTTNKEGFVHKNIANYKLICDYEVIDDDISSGEILLYEIYEYDIFRLNSARMKEIDNNHKRFQENVGYHTDHDPDVYKPFSSPQGWQNFYSDKNPNSTNESIIEKDHIATITSENILWMSIPK
jgi:hypothetical protein